jgi:hypothetical protein
MADGASGGRLRLNLDSRVSLTPGSSLTATGIEDGVSGASFEINATAQEALRLLLEDFTVRAAAGLLAEQWSLPSDVAIADLCQLLTSLDEDNLIVVEGPPPSRRLASATGTARHYLTSPMAGLVALQNELDGEWGRMPSRRYAATVFGIVLATVRAMRYVIAAGCVVVPLMLGFAYALAARAPGVGVFAYSTDLIRSVVVTFLFTVATVIHETGHLAVLKLARAKVHYVSARTSGVSIRHETVGPVTDGLVALAGPVAACCFCVLVQVAIGPGASYVGVGVRGINALLIVGLLNLVTLTPWAADGRAFWNAVRVLARRR